MNVAVCIENENIDEDIQLLRDALAKDDELMGERLARLAALLREMGY